MVQADSRAAAHADMLRKVFDLGGHGMTRSLAEDILLLDFPQREADRISKLNERANEGALTESEEAKMEAYVNVADLLAFWQSRARQALQDKA